MATIKSYSDLEQSRKLATILPLESADMYWDLLSRDGYAKVNNIGHCLGKHCVYAWSLAALMNIIESLGKVEINFNCSNSSYWVNVHFESMGSFCQDHELYDSKIDALFAVIIKLYKRNLLNYDNN